MTSGNPEFNPLRARFVSLAILALAAWIAAGCGSAAPDSGPTTLAQDLEAPLAVDSSAVADSLELFFEPPPPQDESLLQKILRAYPDLAELEDLLGRDTDAVSVEWLKRTPLFDALRGRQDFDALLTD